MGWARTEQDRAVGLYESGPGGRGGEARNINAAGGSDMGPKQNLDKSGYVRWSLN